MMATVNPEDLKPNSHAYREEQRLSAQNEQKDTYEKVQKMAPAVEKNAIVSTKKSPGKKFAEKFVAEQGKELGQFVLWDLIVPGVKNTILDFLSMAFFGESISRGRDCRSYERRRDERRDYTRYSSSERSRSTYSRRDDSYSSGDEVDYKNIVLRDRVSAERIVDKMHWRIEDVGSATVADLLDLLGLIGKYTDNNWGWDRKDDIRIRRISSGFLIDVTEPRYLG